MEMISSYLFGSAILSILHSSERAAMFVFIWSYSWATGFDLSLGNYNGFDLQASVDLLKVGLWPQLGSSLPFSEI